MIRLSSLLMKSLDVNVLGLKPKKKMKEQKSPFPGKTPSLQKRAAAGIGKEGLLSLLAEG